MPWEFASDRPIYLQLMEKIQQKIISGEYAPGERLPSVRELAAEAAVNPNTMQKALVELERAGLVFAQRTSGRYITEDAGLIQQLKRDVAAAEAAEFLQRLGRLGFAPQQAVELLQEAAGKNGKNL